MNPQVICKPVLRLWMGLLLSSDGKCVINLLLELDVVVISRHVLNRKLSLLGLTFGAEPFLRRNVFLRRRYHSNITASRDGFVGVYLIVSGFLALVTAHRTQYCIVIRSIRQPNTWCVLYVALRAVASVVFLLQTLVTC